MPNYHLRSSGGIEGEADDSDEEQNLDTTIMANTGESTTGGNAEQMAAILASINALKSAVEGLRTSTVESQNDLERLRSQIQGQTNAQIIPLQRDCDATTTNSTASVGATPECDSNVKLYDLPTFSGNAEEWPLFLANFKDTSAAFRYSDRQNLMRLHKCLTGQAREAVASMLIYPNDVSKAMEELEFRFGRPDILVRHQLNKIQQFPAIGEKSMDQVVAFSTKVRNVVAFLMSAGCQQHLANPSLLEQLVSKLPPNKQFDWARHAVTIKPYATINDFAVWLGDLARIVCLMPASVLPLSRNTTSQPQQQLHHHQTQPRRLMHVNEDTQKRELKCFQCGERHMIADCKIFRESLNVHDRWQKVKSLQLCFSCLRKGHNTTNCRNKRYCGINGCRRQHHQCLHEEPSNNQVYPKPSTTVAAKPLLNCRLPQAVGSQLFKIIPVTLFGPNGKIDTFAMFDDGSAVSLLEERVANVLGLKGQSQPLTLQWYGEKVRTEASMRVSVEVSGRDEATKFSLKNIRTIHDLSLPVQSFKRSDHKHFHFLPLNDYEKVQPVMLIGLDYVHLGVAATVVQAGDTSPVAAQTRLGWVAYGPTNASSVTRPVVLHIREERSLNELNKIVSEYFADDSLDLAVQPAMLESDDNMQARKTLESTTKRVGKRFETGLLWKEYPPALPNSFEMAKTRLISIERKMSRDPNFSERYSVEMQKYIDKGYARRLKDEELEDMNYPVWYLPHFAVQSPHKPGKLRIVFDAAAAVAGVSLNSVLYKGPEQAKPLLCILFKFREGPVAVAADIREMFSQVKIRQVDQQTQRFLWRNGDINQPFQHFAMVSMIFGAICSPCCAEFIKNRNAEDFKERHPDAVTAIIEKHYVDDFVCSFQDEENAINICQQVVRIHAAAGFELRNFTSNSNRIQNKMNKMPLQHYDGISMERQATTDKVLGMYWDTKTDTFRFHTKFHRIPLPVLQSLRAPTKRELLGIAMAIFDPYGLLADFLIFSKLLVQETWKCKISWDDPIPIELHNKWKAWWCEFQQVKEFNIRRCYSPALQKSSNVQLHIFVDASQLAFAAVGYFRTTHFTGVDVSFVAGKTRCAPQKLMSVPRLELQAAVLGVRLSKLIRQNHDIRINKSDVIFWSDSRTVLYWINSSERKFKAFVGHRVAAIHNISHPSQWRWVPTDKNAADVATRPTFPPKFHTSSIWITGPEFLKMSEEDWPVAVAWSPPETALEEEAKPCLLLQSKASSTFIKFNQFSSYLRLKRTIAWVLRASNIFLNRARYNRRPPAKGLLTVTEINDAEELICQLVQQEAYSVEISALKAAKPIPKQSPIYALTPYLDDKNLIRISGRIDEAQCLPFNARRPLLMPPKHVVSELIMHYYHQKYHHQNSSVIINELRQRFWLPHAKSVLKNVQRNCVTCKMERVKPVPPFMGQLPADRLTPFVRPFTYSGVDLFGPFNVSIGRRREKRWAVIFTCMTVNAAHLELAENLSTDAFLVCLRNFVNRRGTPIRIRSDNGTNFIGAQKELKDAERLLDTDRISDEATGRNIEWVFNCPANPSSGGCWERLIRVIKRLLHKTLHEEAPRVETLRTVLIEAENIINSRPLTDIPLTTEEDEPLTPNHFLLGCVNSTQTPHPVDNEICLRKQWRIAQNLKDRMWKKWVLEYLPQLLCRPKWQEKAAPLKINELVLVCDPMQPRSQWKRGRITKVFPAKDGHIRIAEVKTATGLLRRPATRLAILAVDGESPRNSRGVEC